MKILTALFDKIDESRILDRNLLKNGDTYDKTLLWVLLSLLCFGLVMVYSASVAQTGNGYSGNRYLFLQQQAQYALYGLIVSYVMSRAPMWRWQRWSKLLVPLTGILLLAVWAVGEKVNGASRWLPTPFGFKVQPSEIAKLVTIVYMASFFKRKVDYLHDFRRVSLVGIPVGIGAFLILVTRDLGSVVVVLGIALGLLFLVNLPARWFWSAVAILVSVVAVLIASSEFRMRRIGVMWRPWEDPYGTGYQGLGSLLSLDRGGLWGTGLGNAVFKRGFLPEAHTDFILAVIAEEMGLVAVFCVIAAYLWLIWRAFSIGKQARDLKLYFNAFIAIGIGLWVAAQSFINIGVNISLLPNKGLTLPLISYGGSSLMVMMVAFTMLLRVDYENRRVLRGYCVADPLEKKSVRPQAARNNRQEEYDGQTA